MITACISSRHSGRGMITGFLGDLGYLVCLENAEWSHRIFILSVHHNYMEPISEIQTIVITR